MRRPVWLIVVLLALGLWLWLQPRAPGLAPGVAPDTAPPATAPSLPASTQPAAPAIALPQADAQRADVAYPAFLPVEAHEVLERIARHGPFPYRQDGSVFQNRERRLPRQPRGYYHEYTVATPGSPDRGARRIITGGGVPGESLPEDYWYTDDHYRSFQHFEVSP